MPKSPFVHPDQVAGQPLAQVEAVLLERGTPATCAGVLAELLLVAWEHLGGRSVAADVDDLEWVLDELTEHVCDVGGERSTEDVALLGATAFLARMAFRPTIWHCEPATLVAGMVEHLAKRDTDYSDALATTLGRSRQAVEELVQSGLITALLERGLVDPGRFLDPDAIRNTTKGVPGRTWSQQERDREPALPDFWIALHPARAMQAFGTILEREPIETLGALALGLERCLDLPYTESRARREPSLVSIAERLCVRRRTEQHEQDVLLTRCCWTYGCWAIEASPDCLVEDRGLLRALALAELGKMRGWLRDKSGDGALRFAEHSDYLHEGLFFVLRTDPAALWDVLRRLLLALRELAHRAVPLDLRSWDEGQLEPLPRPWGWVPDHLARALGFFLSRELKRDPALEALRGKLAQFCLDRLKTTTKVADDVAVTDADLVEPDPIWRIGYLHAVRELHVNPGGRGHNVLAWSQRRDPSELVREEAKLAHAAVRRGHGLPPGVSPRRAVYAAVWWMKQAHVLALGDVPAEAGALRTYRKEARRARELDEQFS